MDLGLTDEDYDKIKKSVFKIHSLSSSINFETQNRDYDVIGFEVGESSHYGAFVDVICNQIDCKSHLIFRYFIKSCADYNNVLNKMSTTVYLDDFAGTYTNEKI